jgi:hypothetical protein
MATTKQQYVAAADSNTSLTSPQNLSIPLGEGLMLPRHVNDAVRALMADEAIDLRMSGRPAKTAETFVVKLVENNDALGSMPAQGGLKLEIDGAVNPHLVFAGTSSATVTYTFDTSDESMTGALRFYADSSQGVEHTTGVTVVGTPGTAGSYTSIAVTEATPRILYYQLAGSAGLGGLAISSASSEALANVTGAVTQAQAAATDAYNYAYIAGATPTSNAEYFKQQSADSATNSFNYTFKAGTAPTNNAEYFFEQADLSAQNAANSATAAFNHTYKTGTSTNANAEYYNEEAQAAKLAAEGHAGDAQIALTSILAAVDDNVYLGGHASDPTTDNDGNALLTGAAYYNTTAGEVRFYTGSAWVASGGGGISTDAGNDIVAATGDGLAFFDLSANTQFTAVQNTANTANSTAGAALPAAGGTISGSLTVQGDLSVNGTTTTVNTTNLEVTDANITVAKNAVTAADANGAGLTVAGAAAATFIYASTPDRWEVNKALDVAGNITTTGTVDGVDVSSLSTTVSGKQDNITATSGTINAQALTTVVDSTNVDVRTAKDFQQGTAADIVGGATLYNATAAITLTMDTTKLGVGDIATIYAGNGNVTIAQDATNPFSTIKIDGSTSAVTGNRTIASGSLATITVVSSGVAVIAGQGVV